MTKKQKTIKMGCCHSNKSMRSLNLTSTDILTFIVRLNNIVNIVLLAGIDDIKHFFFFQNMSNQHWVAAIQIVWSLIPTSQTFWCPMWGWITLSTLFYFQASMIHIFSSEQMKCHNKSKLHWVAFIQIKCEVINPSITDILTPDVWLNNTVNIVLLSGINDTHIFSSEQMKCHNKSKLHWVAAIQIKCEIINPNIERHFDS